MSTTVMLSFSFGNFLFPNCPASTTWTIVTVRRTFLSFHAAAAVSKMKSRISQTVRIEAPSNRPRNSPTCENREKGSDKIQDLRWRLLVVFCVHWTYFTEKTEEFKGGLLVDFFNCQVLVVDVQIQKVFSKKDSVDYLFTDIADWSTAI